MNIRTKVPSATASFSEQANTGSVVAAKAAAAAIPSRVEAAPARETPAYPPKIAAALIRITRAITPVVKAGENTFHKYMYPKWEHVLGELGPKITEAGLIIIQNEVQHAGFERDLIEITYNFTIINEDGEVWPDKPEITAICKVRDGKGVLDDKASSKCYTQAQKYFLMGLFKVRTRDMDEADHDAGPQGNGRQRSRRVVPSTSGKLPPHALDIINGETPTSWADRFIACINKAESEDEIVAWDKENDGVLGRIQERSSNQELTPQDREDAAGAYNKIVDALNARYESVKPKPASRTLVNEVAKEDAAQPLTDDERDWLAGLEGAFSGCEDLDSLESEANRLMNPSRNKVTSIAWIAAVAAYNRNAERINGDGS